MKNIWQHIARWYWRRIVGHGQILKVGCINRTEASGWAFSDWWFDGKGAFPFVELGQHGGLVRICGFKPEDLQRLAAM